MKAAVSANAVMHALQLGDTQEAAKELLALVDMINQAVGDALSGILLVEAALRRRKWGLNEWATLYTDLPSRQLKVTIRSRWTHPAWGLVDGMVPLDTLTMSNLCLIKSYRCTVSARRNQHGQVVRICTFAATP